MCFIRLLFELQSVCFSLFSSVHNWLIQLIQHLFKIAFGLIIASRKLLNLSRNF